MSSVTCPGCGAEVEEGLWFCPVCSTQVAGPSVDGEHEEEPWTPPRFPLAADQAERLPTVPGWIWPVSALTLLLIVAVVAGVLALT